MKAVKSFLLFLFLFLKNYGFGAWFAWFAWLVASFSRLPVNRCFVFLQVFQINVQYCLVSHVAVGSCFVLSLIGSGGVLGAVVYCNY